MKNTFHNHGGGPFGTTTMNCTCGDPDGPHPSLVEFGKKTLEEIAQDTIKRCQKTSVAVYLATEEGPASDISECLKEAAEVIGFQDQMIKAIQKVHDVSPPSNRT